MKVFWYFILYLWVISALAQYKIVESHNLISANNAPAAHASTLLDLENGELLAAWFSGKHEGHPEVGISLAKYENHKWQEAVEIAKAENIDGTSFPCWNPVLVKNDKGRVLLFYKVGKNPREWWGQFIYSDDLGESWSKPEKLPEGFLGPVRVKSLQLENGKILHPSSTESKDEDWKVHFELSDENGKKFERIAVNCDTFQVIQPTLIQTGKHKLKFLARSKHNKVIAADSKDNGKTWSGLYPIDLPNPNSGIDAINIDKNRFLMVYNPLSHGKEWWEGRNKLVLGRSNDGTNWLEILELENHEKGEYSYPAIIATSNGKIHISYTNNRKNIKHLVLEKN